MHKVRGWLYGLAVLWATSTPAMAQHGPSLDPPAPGLFRQHLADYNAELRRADGRVDTDAMVMRLKDLGVTTYYWLIWHAPTDWDDLKLFLPKAREAGIEVWVYLVPPSEGPPSEPFRLDYPRWAEEIARLSLKHANLTAWVIDDFYANRKLFTPAYLREFQTRSKRVNPRLAFLPLMYPDEVQPQFVEDYREVIDGVVVAYLQDHDEIEWLRAVLDDAVVFAPLELSYPAATASHPGDFAMASQSVRVLPAQRYLVRFREHDDFTGETAGYHFKQLLLDGAVVWEEDVAGGPARSWSSRGREIAVDVTRNVRDKTSVSLAFRLVDRKAVSNFGVQWRVSEFRPEGLQPAADVGETQQWKVSRQGAFAAGFGDSAKAGRRRFQVPFISMVAADAHEFRLRHGDPAAPERIAGQLRVSLQAWRDGKCDGVVTYCLDKRPQSQTFPHAQKLFREFKAPGSANTRGPAAGPARQSADKPSSR
jgi:hypothetical protein